jgi:bifunctional non-homologous end joining protein LigD
MSLEKYVEKRNFKETAEPKGAKKKSSKEHIFVIQRHHASRLHYDFRLEVDGVLKSWAVPKGPSMNPADKRLAMEVEDHPYDYKDFEGVIPEGNYGAGYVHVWDKGSFELLRDDGSDFDKEALKELKDGDLKIRLKGKKVKGEFALVKMKRSDDNAWLLLKHKDKYAVSEQYDSEDYTPQRIKDKGVKQKELMKEHKEGSKKKVKVVVEAPPEAPVAKTKTKHKDVMHKPMMATLVDSVFSRKGWLFETKWDGYRAIADVQNGKVSLYSRNQLSFNKDYPSVVKSVEKISHNVVLDGEIVVMEKNGTSNFQALQSFRSTGKGNLVYVVFDLLELDGEDLRELPLVQRKELLEDIIKQLDDDKVLYSSHVMNDGEKLYERAKKKGWEGIIAKEAESMYSEGSRSSSWLKMKVVDEQEAIICGYTAPRGSRKKIGALVLGVYEGAELKYIGHCGGGLNGELIDELYTKLQANIQTKSPFKERVKTNMPVTWVKPVLVCQMKFSSWTEGGHLRQPIFLGLRKDKTAKEVHRETAKDTNMVTKNIEAAAKETPGKEGTSKETTKKESTVSAKKTTKAAKKETSSAKAASPKATYENERMLKLNGKQVKLTNQNKLYWEEEGISKGELVDYYMDMADYILPYLKDRPMSLHRFPNGIKDPGFYQKDVDKETAPEWLKTVSLHAASASRDVDYLLCNNAATLAYMVNLGCIEQNPWLSRVNKLDNPDYIVLDLDPEAIAFKYVVETALTIKETLDDMNITAFCKTSGASGIHIYIPTGAKYNYDTCRLFAEYVARQVQAKLPRTTSVIRAKSQRNKKVYIDFLQNSRGQTVAAPYSVRPKPGATVSAPLRWDELTDDLAISDFTLYNMRERVAELGDLWEGIDKVKNDLKSVINNIQAEAE